MKRFEAAGRLRGALFATALLGAFAGPAWAQEKVLRIAMTAADIPRTLGQPDQGFEGNRFTGIPMYDALTHWDLSQGRRAQRADPRPGHRMGGGRQGQDQVDLQAAPGREVPRRLARSTPTPWSGTCARCWTRTRRTSTPSQVGVTASRMPTLRSAEQDRRPTVELTTSEPDSLPADQPDQPVHGLARRTGRRSSTPLPGADAGRQGQAGLGRLRRRRLGHRARSRWRASCRASGWRWCANKAYWDAKRAPKIDRVVLLPMPEANARTAALLSGQVDWIEAPAPDAMAADPGARLHDLHQPAAACLALAALLRRRLALARQARAPGRQPVRRPRRAEASCWAA